MNGMCQQGGVAYISEKMHPSLLDVVVDDTLLSTWDRFGDGLAHSDLTVRFALWGMEERLIV